MAFSSTVIVVQQYFTTKRALAAGLTFCGLSVGSLAAAPGIATLLSIYGWRGTFLLHGAIMLNG